MAFYLEPVADKIMEKYRDHYSFHEGDVGIDLFVPLDTVVPPRGKAVIDLFVKAAYYTAANEPSGYLLAARSSIVNRNLIIMNGVGIIDAGYRGTLKVALWNPTWDPVKIKQGDRVCQICAPDLKPVSMIIGRPLDDTSRGTGGFGSTGQ